MFFPEISTNCNQKIDDVEVWKEQWDQNDEESSQIECNFSGVFEEEKKQENSSLF